MVDVRLQWSFHNIYKYWIILYTCNSYNVVHQFYQLKNTNKYFWTITVLKQWKSWILDEISFYLNLSKSLLLLKWIPLIVRACFASASENTLKPWKTMVYSLHINPTLQTNKLLSNFQHKSFFLFTTFYIGLFPAMLDINSK